MRKAKKNLKGDSKASKRARMKRELAGSENSARLSTTTENEGEDLR